jgi:hypothetical protein
VSGTRATHKRKRGCGLGSSENILTKRNSVSHVPTYVSSSPGAEHTRDGRDFAPLLSTVPGR